jgi:glycine/D-amino acid oxidase-like deaminating enzyme/Rieske Fe-S protein
MDFSQETHSIWQKSDPPFFPSLGTNESVDVCVVGGGIAGLTTAYRLLEEGLSVAVLERNGFQSGETLRTSAHLATSLDDRYFEIAKRHGPEGARSVARAHESAIDDIEHLARQESIDCDFLRVPGYLFLAPGDSPETLARELAACHEAGLGGVEYLTAGQSPLFPTGPCLRFPQQARFHAGRYLAGLARAVQRRGGKVYSNTEAVDFEGGKPARVLTNRGFQVVSEAIVLATNTPLGGLTLSAKMAPYRSYVLGIPLPADRVDLSLFWDTAGPYHYLRTVFDGTDQILLVGGGDHRTGQMPSDDPFARLAAWARDRLGLTGKPRYHWSGQVLEPHDMLAFLGASPVGAGNVFVVTAHSGSGLTYGTFAARLLADLIAGREHPLTPIFDPARVNIRSIGTYLSENAIAATPYTDWLTPGDVANLEEIPRGEGAVLREGLHKLAVYRDDHGHPHFFSAVCPHLRGIVRWNETEKTWDCPCHGSRFDRMGHVLNGPATTGLAAISDALDEAQGEAISA